MLNSLSINAEAYFSGNMCGIQAIDNPSADQGHLQLLKSAIFRDTVGQSPNDYLTDLRGSMVQDLLKQNKSVNVIASTLGYEHGSALARIFRKKSGLSPKEWMQKLIAR